jgi:hypothetical protein
LIFLHHLLATHCFLIVPSSSQPNQQSKANALDQQHHYYHHYNQIMFKLTHLITVLMATVAVASPQKLALADCQVPLGVPVDSADVDLPIRDPPTETVLRIYDRLGCNTTLFKFEANLAPTTCYYLPYHSATLLFHTCGQGEFRPFTLPCLAFPPLLPHLQLL